jgi:hypothetical protein
LQRVLQGVAAQISTTFYSPPGTVADPGAVTVTVRSDDGTALATGAATGGTGAAARTFTLTPTMTAQLDSLSVTWTSPTLGTPPADRVEVVGGFLFSTVDAEAVIPGATDTQIQAIRTRVEQAIEDACGCAFVPRYDHATLNGDGTTLLRLGRPYLRRVRWASTVTSGVTTTLVPADLAALSFSTAGFVSGYTWLTGYGNVLVGFEHGMDRPPEPVKAAALDYARFLLTQDTSIDSRAERLVTDDGTLVFGGGATGLPSVDRVIDSYRIPVIA